MEYVNFIVNVNKLKSMLCYWYFEYILVQYFALQYLFMYFLDLKKGKANWALYGKIQVKYK